MIRDEKSRFNKPHHRNESHRPTQGGSYGILPAPGILESYEEISPGAVKQILELVQDEQNHRHKWENSYLKTLGNNHKIGQLLIFVLAIVILYSAIALVSANKLLVGVVVSVLGFGFLSILAIANSISSKEVERPRKRFYRPNKK